jgi:hypothetical protein
MNIPAIAAPQQTTHNIDYDMSRVVDFGHKFPMLHNEYYANKPLIIKWFLLREGGEL